MPSIAEAAAQVTGPGGPMETVVEDVLGQPIQVYKNRMQSLRELMAQNEARRDVTFVVQGDQRLNYGEHDRTARRLAGALGNLGVQRGDRVALISANNPEWVLTFWACAILGAVCVPLNAWQKTDELQFALDDSGAKVVIADRKRMDAVLPVVDALPAVEHYYLIGARDPGDVAIVRELADLLDGDDDPGMPPGEIAEDDILAILYTSGMTGRPKGATITHRQVIANLQNIICLGVIQLMAGITKAGAQRGGAPDAGSGGTI